MIATASKRRLMTLTRPPLHFASTTTMRTKLPSTGIWHDHRLTRDVQGTEPVGQLVAAHDVVLLLITGSVARPVTGASETCSQPGCPK